MKNWWYYYKWYVICGIVLAVILIRLLGNAFGLFKRSPDVQIAYVGESALPADTVSALENAFSSLAGDYNQDGEVLIQVNQYVSGNKKDMDADTLSYRQASMITLMADINDCESYFFLMEDAEDVQREFQVLAMPDGTCPPAADFSARDKAFPWDSFHLLSEMDLGSYTTTILGQSSSGSNQELLSGLYLGRRCFYNEQRCKHSEECSNLWDTLQGG